MSSGPSVSRPRLFLRIAGLVWTVAPRQLVTVLVVTAVAACLPAAGLVVTSRSVQAMADAVSHGDGVASDATIAVLALAAFLVLTQVTGAVRGYVETLLQRRLADTVTTRITAKALRLDLEHFENPDTYDKLQRATREGSFRPYQVFGSLLALVSYTVTLTSTGAVLVSWSVPAAVLMLLAPMPLALVRMVYDKRCWRLEHDRSSSRRRLAYFEHLVTHDQPYKELHLFGIGALLHRRVVRTLEQFYLTNRLIERRHAIVSGVVGVGSASVVGVGILLALRSAARTGQLGEFAGYVTSVVMVHTTVKGFFESFAQLHEHGLYLGNLFAFFDIPDPVRKPGSRRFPGQLAHGVEFRGVSFTYPGTDRPVLDGVDLYLPAGSCTALVGVNGSGKSTVVKLLCRFYEPTCGQILVDGVPLTEFAVDDVRDHVGVIFQDFLEYETSVHENIGFGRLARLDDRAGIQRAARQAGAASILDALPEGIDTALGRWFDGGHQLSGGQWQKIGLARAFFRAAPITVLDEPTAAVDAVAEAEIFGRMRDIATTSTMLLIAHRFSTVRAAADRIVVLADGKVAEEGTHAQLLADGGRYARMFGLQAAGYHDTGAGLVT